MGVAMAQAAQRLGAEVTLIHGPLSIDLPEGILSVPIISAEDLFQAVQKNSEADAIIMAAAVSDFTPVLTHTQKVKKEVGESSIELKKTTDILSWLGKHKKPNQTLIGFAMETEHLIENATKKLSSKNADWIIANSLSSTDAGFAVDTNHVHLINQNSSPEFKGTKQEVAEMVLGKIFES